MKFTSIIALVAVAQAIKIKSKDAHPCELLEADGDDVDTSLAVQLDSQVKIDEPNVDQFKALAEKLDIELTPELLSLGSNEEISNALIEIALGMGKTESDITAAMGGA